MSLLTRKLLNSIRWRLLSPKIPLPLLNNLPKVTLGSWYGRKTFINLFPQDQDLVVISGGVGQDISFDVELIELIKAKVYLVDPTELALHHYESVISRKGSSASSQYSQTSIQKPSSYNLARVNCNNLIFVQAALWNEIGKVNFYLPPENSRDRSGSIHGIHYPHQRKPKPESLDSVTIEEICKKYDIRHIDLLKLDIEGAALEVLTSTFDSKIYPDQILIEFDEIHFPGIKNKLRTRKLVNLIEKNDYILVNRDSCDFTYLRKNLV